MEHKAVNFVIQGMQSDTAPSRADSKFAYENMNIRMTAMADKTLLAITNEKGNKKFLPKTEEGANVSILGKYVGHCVVGKYLVLFTTDNLDRIYRLHLDNDNLICHLVVQDKLNFSEEYPLETLGVYENETIQKVYWVDGNNPVRFINIVSDKYNTLSTSDEVTTIFDFSGKVPMNQTLEISKNVSDNGMLEPGVIQYAYSFYDKNGRESTIVDVSSLYYVTQHNRGASSEDVCSNSFTITLNNIDNKDYKYDYVRIYSIHRTSINGTPIVKVVQDLKLNHDEVINNVSCIDKGTSGTIISATELLFKGGESIIANTISSKDNTLFLGNFKHNRSKLSTDIKEALKKLKISISNKTQELLSDEGKYYTYKFQLDNSLKEISTFKQGETYRFGVQLQDALGKWSEVVFIEDKEMPYSLNSEGNNVNLIMPTLVLDVDTKSKLTEYKKIRGVVVFPSNIDRTIITQGIICPTVFNLASRCNGNIYAQSSWFARPFAPEAVKADNDITSPFFDSFGSPLEFRHEYLIPVDVSINSDKKYVGTRNIEIGVGPKVKSDEYTERERRYRYVPTNPWGSEAEDFKEENSLFYVDQSVVTFHSPEFYFTKEYGAISQEDLKLKIVGYVPLTAYASDSYISTQSAGLGADNIRTFFKRNATNKSVHGYKSMCSELFYLDSIYRKDNVNNTTSTSFLITPWHRNGSLNDTPKNIPDDKARTAILKNKVLSNIKFSSDSIFLNENDQWKALSTDYGHAGITRVQMYDSENPTIVKIPKPNNSDLEDIIYQGNIDTILNGYNNIFGAYTKDLESNITEIFNEDIDNYSQDPVSMKYKSTPHAVFAFNYTSDNKQVTMPCFANKTVRNGNPVWLIGKDNSMSLNSISVESIPESSRIIELYSITDEFPKYKELVELDDPEVLVFKSDENAFYRCKGMDSSTETIDWVDRTDTITRDSYFRCNLDGEVMYYIWEYESTPNDNLYTSSIKLNPEYGGFYLAELYRDIDVSTRFGGNNEEQIEYNIWYPAGSAVNISQEGDTTIEYTEGDTFYQRFDCLKTYPYTNEDQNSIVEIVSFMCENRLNIDGRYDRNRGLTDNTTITPKNFNLFNEVYSQQNNYFNYSTTTPESDIYPTTLTWTLPKALGEKIDTWTNITLASTLTIDGNKGELQKIHNHNNELILFQDKAISKLLFNSRIQLAASDGVPIEIANSGKVNGNVYITQDIGASNKWSIVSSPNGIYFIDNLNQGIYLFNGDGCKCASDMLNMSSFIKENNSLDKWNPKDFNNFRSFYDRINNDIYFINDKKCLCYSELLGQFTSYFNYERTPMLVSFDDKLIAYKDSCLWEQFAGEYNSFYGEIKPFYTTIVANMEPVREKIFNSIDFRSDTYSGDTILSRTFDTLEVWNEYQRGRSKLANIIGRPSSLKQKFRVWRAQIPRHNNTLQRIRNPWCYIKLSMENPSNYKTVLHDITVSYTV